MPRGIGKPDLIIECLKDAGGPYLIMETYNKLQVDIGGCCPTFVYDLY